MRPFLRGRPGLILVAGIALMFYGFVATCFLMAFGWGGFVTEPIAIQIIGFGFTGALFLSGLALASIGGYRCCRSLGSTESDLPAA